MVILFLVIFEKSENFNLTEKELRKRTLKPKEPLFVKNNTTDKY